jgi:hypothetical protein
MSHLDEGTLHALLDGELELAEVREIQLHLGTCAACDARLQDVKQFLAEADQLVEALEIPAGSGRVRHEPAPPPVRPDPAARDLPPWEPAPELLLPESVQTFEGRGWGRAFRWAAMIVVVLGVGRVLQDALRPGKPRLELTARDQAPPPATPAVVSPQETGRPAPADDSEAAAPAQEFRSAPANPTRAGKAAREPKAVASQPAPAVGAAGGVSDETDTESVVAAKDSGALLDSQTVALQSRTAGAGQSGPEQDLATRQAAAAALEELDRERLRSRANAATASLPPARSEVQAAPEPAPPPRTLEQRAQVYLRIGLDEAVTQLGRPVHVIEAMTPEFIGLTPGRLVAGADPNRPVVRVVYVDRGRMILLDQQRLRTGQGPGAASGNLRWTQGDVMLYLHGEPAPDVLRNLQRRVR